MVNRAVWEGVTVIFGRPGTGKTTLAMRIAQGYVDRGEGVFWMSLYEDRETFFSNARKLGYRLEPIEFWEAVLVRPDAMYNYIVSATSQGSYRLVVVDSLTPLMEVENPREYLLNLVYRTFRPAKMDMVLIAEEEKVVPLDYVADNLVRMEMRFLDGSVERRMYVVKSRGRKAGYYMEFDIIEGRGLVFLDDIPKLVQRPRRVIPTGIKAIDGWTGGIPTGSVWIIKGPRGTGKTALAARMAAGASQNGARVLFRTFNADPQQLEAYIEKLGGRAVVQRVEPTTGHFSHMLALYEALERHQPDLVVSDGIDLEFLLYGRKALQLNIAEVEELRKANIPLIVTTTAYRGLSYIADYLIELDLERALLKGGVTHRKCTYWSHPEPDLECP